MKEHINYYKQMRVILFYDLPMTEDSDQKIYNRFHKNLKRNGFYMLQYSIYMKVVTNQSGFNQIKNKLQRIVPPKGSVIVFQLTEKQFQNMIILRGERNLFEAIVGGNELVVFGGEEIDR